MQQGFLSGAGSIPEGAGAPIISEAKFREQHPDVNDAEFADLIAPGGPLFDAFDGKLPGEPADITTEMVFNFEQQRFAGQLTGDPEGVATLGRKNFTDLVISDYPDLTETNADGETVLNSAGKKFIKQQEDVATQEKEGAPFMFPTFDLDARVGDFQADIVADFAWGSASEVAGGPGTSTPDQPYSASKISSAFNQGIFGQPGDERGIVRKNENGQIEYKIDAIQSLFDPWDKQFYGIGEEPPVGLTRRQIRDQMRQNAPDMLENPTGATQNPASTFWKGFDSVKPCYIVHGSFVEQAWREVASI